MFYDVVVFVHVCAAILWIGSGFLLQLLASLADRRRDEPTFAALIRFSDELGLKLFVPASLTAFLAGVVLVADGPWTAGQLWVLIGLAGFAATFLTGLLVLKPRGEQLAALVERDGGTLGPEATELARRLLAIGRIDYVVLAVVVFDMAVKPATDDVWTLVAMAVAVVAGLAVVLGRARQAEVAYNSAA